MEISRVTSARIKQTLPVLLLAAAVLLVDRCPGDFFGLLLRDTLFLVALFNVLGLSFLLIGIAGFVSAWHKIYRRGETKQYT